MPSSLVKFSNRSVSGNERLWWGRADVDGLPFRGASPPFMTEEEFEVKAVRVADTRNAFFDVTDLEQNKNYLDVLDCCFNGWFRLVHLERFWDGTTKHYVEWVEYYLEDGTRTPLAHTGSIMEMMHGQQHFPGNLGQGTNGIG